MTHRDWENKDTLSCVVIHSSTPKKLGGNRTCGRVLLTRHLVQELSVDTVKNPRFGVSGLTMVFCDL